MKHISDTDRNSGFAFLTVFLIIFSISVLCMALTILVSSDNRLIKSYGDRKYRYAEADRLCGEIEQSFNTYFTDCDDSEGLHAVLEKYSKYGIKIEAVSDCLNTGFIDSKILQDKAILSYIQRHESTAGYNWVNPNLADRNFIQNLVTEHNVKDYSELFPIVNYLPMLNVHNIDADLLKTVLEFCGVENASFKADSIYNRVSGGEIITGEELKKTLDTRESSAVWDFIGVKTQFYRVEFSYRDIDIELVIGAVPYRQERIREVESYRIVERKVA